MKCLITLNNTRASVNKITFIVLFQYKSQIFDNIYFLLKEVCWLHESFVADVTKQ